MYRAKAVALNFGRRSAEKMVFFQRWAPPTMKIYPKAVADFSGAGVLVDGVFICRGGRSLSADCHRIVAHDIRSKPRRAVYPADRGISYAWTWRDTLERGYVLRRALSHDPPQPGRSWHPNRNSLRDLVMPLRGEMADSRRGKVDGKKEPFMRKTSALTVLDRQKLRPAPFAARAGNEYRVLMITAECNPGAAVLGFLTPSRSTARSFRPQRWHAARAARPTALVVRHDIGAANRQPLVIVDAPDVSDDHDIDVGLTAVVRGDTASST